MKKPHASGDDCVADLHKRLSATVAYSRRLGQEITSAMYVVLKRIVATLPEDADHLKEPLLEEIIHKFESEGDFTILKRLEDEVHKLRNELAKHEIDYPE